MSKSSTDKVAHAQKTLNMLRYLAITKPSLDGRKQDEEMAPKKEATLDGAETQGEEVDPQAVEEQADTAQAKAIGELMASVQQLQEELVAQKAMVAKQVEDTSKLHVRVRRPYICLAMRCKSGENTIMTYIDPSHRGKI